MKQPHIKSIKNHPDIIKFVLKNQFSTATLFQAFPDIFFNYMLECFKKLRLDVCCKHFKFPGWINLDYIEVDWLKRTGMGRIKKRNLILGYG